MSPERLILFARFPSAGRVKTRLSPVLDHDRAALLYRSFLLDLVSRLGNLHGIDLSIAVAGEPGDVHRMEEMLRDRLNHDGVKRFSLVEQRGEDLGARMSGAFENAFQNGCRRVMILGADHPTIPRQVLIDGFEELRQHDGVVGPSVDGGFWGIGLTRYLPDLFQGMTWSTSDVFREICDRLQSAGVDYLLMPEWYDVDRPEDLGRLSREAEAADDLPETRRVLVDLGMISEPDEEQGSE